MGNFNRKRIIFLNSKNLIYLVIIVIVLVILSFSILNKNYIIQSFSNTIDMFSKSFGYEYINLNVTGLNKIEFSYIESKLTKFNNSSIFLLPLDEISTQIKENNWVKNVRLSTNYRDTLFVDIDEYEPIGLYKFNEKLFYFNKNGKIIDEFKTEFKNKKKLITFFGPSSNLNAKSILLILDSLNFLNKYKILTIDFINKRRWDILLFSDIRLMLSENNPEISLQNFINIEKNLSETDLNNIKYFDLRNINKTLIYYD